MMSEVAGPGGTENREEVRGVGAHTRRRGDARAREARGAAQAEREGRDVDPHEGNEPPRRYRTCEQWPPLSAAERARARLRARRPRAAAAARAPV